MNIKEAKDEIKNAMVAYFTKDETGNYYIPIEKQRPVFLMGPPGIGKTAIMEQIAQEMGVGLLSYSMTHHTRQSAMGLPFIVHKNYDGMECDISEYTMSEIIAAIYDLMEKSEVKEGILFLDEINCVSETLAPVMLQFLQYKVFGKHKVPKGWIVVTAGNPPEYNNSVREYDIVTWDRLKRIDVEPDFEIWKEYAYKAKIHESIISFLEIKKDSFYLVESTVHGKSFVTARGWEDLSQMIKLYEMHGIEVNERLISQYLQNKQISKSFAQYYDLYNKYKSDYQIQGIINGEFDEKIINRAGSAKFDEKITVIGLLLDAVIEHVSRIVSQDAYLARLRGEIKALSDRLTKGDTSPKALLEALIESKKQDAENGIKAGSMSADTARRLRKLATFFEARLEAVENLDGAAAYEVIKTAYNNLALAQRENAKEVGTKLENAFVFCEKAFPTGQELLILVTELTANYYSAQYIAKYGCDKYYQHNKELLFYERNSEIVKELDNLDLD